MKQQRRWLGILLSVLMVFSMLPVQALAAETPSLTAGEAPTDHALYFDAAEGKLYWATASADTADYTKGDVYAEQEDKWSAAAGKLTLNGFSFETGLTRALIMSPGSTLEIQGENHLKSSHITGTGLYGEGGLTVTGTGSLETSGAMGIAALDLVIESGNITAKGIGDYGYAIYGQSTTDGHAITIKGGDVKAYGDVFGFYASNEKLNILGGKVYAVGKTSAVFLYNGSLAGESLAIQGSTVDNADVSSLQDAVFQEHDIMIGSEKCKTAYITVAEPMPEGHSHCVCGGSPYHTHTTPIPYHNQLSGDVSTLLAGSYYLAGDVTLTQDITIDGNVDLCLSGHNINADGHSITVKSGTLNVSNCTDSHKITSPILCDGQTAAVNIYGGVVVQPANWQTGGHSVHINAGTANLKACTLYGTVHVDGANSVLNIDESSVIYGNSGYCIECKNGSKVNQHGGTLSGAQQAYIKAEGTGTTVSISGGYMTTSSGDAALYGIACSDNAKLYIGGNPTINSKTAAISAGKESVYASCDGVPYAGDMLNIQGNNPVKGETYVYGVIETNKDKFSLTNEGSILTLENNNLVVDSPLPEGHAHRVCGSAACSHEGHENVEYVPFAVTNGTLSAGSYYLTQNVTSAAVIKVDGTVNLCLNGYTIAGSGASVFNVPSGATLNICDCSSAPNPGKISGTLSAGVTNEGTLVQYGGEISGTKYGIQTTGTATVQGNAIVRASSSTSMGIEVKSGSLSLKDDAQVVAISDESIGVIINGQQTTMDMSGNVHVKGEGYGIQIANSGTATISGGVVTAEDPDHGAGIEVHGANSKVTLKENAYVEAPCGLRVTLNGKAEVSGGRIIAKNFNDDVVYGIYNDEAESILVSGGNISASSENAFAYGIFSSPSYLNGEVTVSGGTINAQSTNSEGLAIYAASKTNISGGTLTSSHYGAYLDDYYGTLTLSGTPSVSGDTAGIYTPRASAITAKDGTAPYTGGNITIEYPYGKLGDIVVKDVTVGTNDKKFSVTSEGKMLKLQGTNLVLGDGTHTITLPTGDGYTLTGDTTAADGESKTYAFALNNGYYKSKDFAVMVNGVPVALNLWNKFTISNITEDKTITVTGVEALKHFHHACGEPTCSHDGHTADVGYQPLAITSGTLPEGNYYLEGDVTLTGDLSIDGFAGKESNLCLNGHVLNLDGHKIIKDSSGGLNICDCTDVVTQGYLDDAGLWHQGVGEKEYNLTGGVITGGYEMSNVAAGPGRAGGAINVGNTDAVVKLYSGNIAGNRAATYGGGVGISQGKFNLYGGSIVGNTQYSESGRGGGGVAVVGGTFNMYGGSVSDNAAVYSVGGGVYLNQGSSSSATSIFNLYGGTIADNSGSGVYAINSAKNEVNISGGSITGNTGLGGVYINGGNLTLSGGEITGNTSTISSSAGGIYYYEGLSFKVSGNPVVKDNKNTKLNGVESNIYISKSALDQPLTITIDGPMTDGAYLGVSKKEVPATGVNVDVTGEYATADYSKYFFSDNPNHYIVYNDSKVQLSTEKPHTHSYGEEWTSDADHHWHECTDPNCPDVNKGKTDVAAHTPGADDGNCTTAITCTVCGAVTTPAEAAHSFTTKASASLASPATCTQAAMYYVQCDRCDAVSSEKTVAVGDPLPHTLTKTEAVAATCISKGNREYWHCSVCKKDFSDANGTTELTDVTTPIDQNNHDFTGDYDEWDENGHWHICNRDGCTGTDTPVAHVFTSYTYNNDATYFANGTETATCDADGCEATDIREKAGSKLTDNAAPTGSITVGSNRWDSFTDPVSFNKFFNAAQSVTIQSADEGSGIDSVFYYLTDDDMTKSELQALQTGWTPYAAGFEIVSDGSYIIYVKITDKVGNTTYLRSDGLVLDKVAPTLTQNGTAVADDAKYYGDTEFTASDLNLATVTVDGTTKTPDANGKFTIPADNQEHTIVVTDRAGNSVTRTVTVNEYFTITYKTNEGFVLGTVQYGVKEKNTLPAANQLRGLFSEAIDKLMETGSLYVKNPLWYSDKDFTTQAVMPQNPMAGAEYVFYCAFTTDTAITSTETKDRTYGGELINGGKFSAYYGVNWSTWRGNSDFEFVYEKKDGDNWVTVDDSFKTDLSGTTWDNWIFPKTVADSGIYRIAYIKASVKDNAGNLLFSEYIYPSEAEREGKQVNVLPRPLTISGVTATDRAYDGTTNVALTGGTLQGLVSNDDVSFTLGSGAIADADVGNAKAVTTSITLTGEDAGNYVLTQPTDLTVNITSASQTAPTVGKTDETIDGKNDGVITGVDSAMEYRKEGVDTYTPITGATVENLADGTYYVRYAAKDNYNPSPDTTVEIAQGRMLEVTFVADGNTIATKQVSWNGSVAETEWPAIPGKTGYDQATPSWDKTAAELTNIQENIAVHAVYTINTYAVTLTGGVGYTLTAVDSASPVNHGGSYTFKLTVAEGYSKTDDFAVKVNGAEVELAADGTYTLSNITAPVSVTVEGVADTTAPAAKITVAENDWTSFLHDITFGLFFKDTQSVTITATDAGSGVKAISYYVSDAGLSLAEVQGITNWQDYTDGFDMDSNGEYVIYARVQDNAGNVAYISSNGLVLDTTAPAISGIEDGETYCGAQSFTVAEENLDKVIVGGIEIFAVNDKYTVSPAEGTQTIVVTDKAGNRTEMTIAVNAGHTFTDYKPNGDATCTQDGTRTAKCDFCDATNTITDAGSRLPHAYGEWLDTLDGQNHKHFCACGAAEIEAHQWDNGKVTREPTKTAKGEKTYTCPVCGATRTEELPALSNLPQTGDTSNMLMWGLLLMLSGLGITGAVLFGRKKRGER